MNEMLLELQDSVRRLVADQGLPLAPDTLWQNAVELGWLLVDLPEEEGGLDAGLEGCVTLLSELAAGLDGSPYFGSAIAVSALKHCPAATEALQAAVAGEAVALSMIDGVLKEDRGQISGRLSAVMAADKAARCLVAVGKESRIEQVLLVDLQQEGVAISAKDTWDLTRRLADVEFTIAANEQTLLASGDEAEALWQRVQAVRDFAIAADATGAANALLALTVEHLHTREQFKRPLAMFQALKHRCADLKAAIVGAEALLQSTCRQHYDSDPRLLVVAGMKARQLACATYRNVAEESLQLHGGIGMADEHVCHLFLKRALLNEQLGRAPSAYPQALAAELLDRV